MTPFGSNADANLTKTLARQALHHLNEPRDPLVEPNGFARLGERLDEPREDFHLRLQDADDAGREVKLLPGSPLPVKQIGSVVAGERQAVTRTARPVDGPARGASPGHGGGRAAAASREPWSSS